MAEYGRFLDRGIPSEVQEKLQIIIRMELGLGEVEGRKIIHVLPMLQQTILKSFLSRRDISVL